MKRLIATMVFVLGIALCPKAKAQAAPHSATLAWTDTQNPAACASTPVQPCTTYSVYRATGICSGTPAFSKLVTGLIVLTYVDSTVIPGNYCYTITATVNGVESAEPSGALASVPAFVVTNLTVTVK